MAMTTMEFVETDIIIDTETYTQAYVNNSASQSALSSTSVTAGGSVRLDVVPPTHSGYTLAAILYCIPSSTISFSSAIISANPSKVGVRLYNMTSQSQLVGQIDLRYLYVKSEKTSSQ